MLTSFYLENFRRIIIPSRTMKPIWRISIIAAVSPIRPPLLLNWSSGILVITHISTKDVVPKIPIKSRALPQSLMVGTNQKTWTKPPVRKRIVVFILLAGNMYRWRIRATPAQNAAAIDSIVTNFMYPLSNIIIKFTLSKRFD